MSTDEPNLLRRILDFIGRLIGRTFIRIPDQDVDIRWEERK